MDNKIKKYYTYKNFFSGIKTMEDIDSMRMLCPKEDNEIVECVVRSMQTSKNTSHVKMIEILKKISKMKYIEDAEEYLNTIHFFEMKPNNFQTDVINKVMPKKNDTSYIDMRIERKCPHCGKMNKAPIDTTYIICGVDPIGRAIIDTTGCLKDWCFSCEKKLCKEWCHDELHDVRNRQHDDMCCKMTAMKTGQNYFEKYCQCMRRIQHTKDEFNFIISDI